MRLKRHRVSRGDGGDTTVSSGGPQINSDIGMEIAISVSTPYDGRVEGMTLGEFGYPNLTTADGKSIVSDAIECLCPSYLSVIPGGDP